MPDVHAKLSASGSHIWLNCTPSIRLSEGIPDKGSAYAEEGTLAHSLAELQLRFFLNRIEVDSYNSLSERIKASEYWGIDMWNYIDQYVGRVLEQYNAIRRSCPDAELLTEQRLNFSEWVPGGFGTGDVVILADETLYVIDLKYGRGVPVSAVYNPQLMLYGLGAYASYCLEYNIRTVHLRIDQPRLDSVSDFEISIEELLDWGKKVVKPRAQMAIAGEGEAVPGDHCRFCKARHLCRARAEEAERLEKRYAQRDAGLLSDDEIGEILGLTERISAWAKDVRDYALEQAIGGKTFKGYKLVEGRSTRKLVEHEKIIEKLEAEGYDRAVLFKEPELLGITDLQRVIGGKKKFEELLSEYIIKPHGAPTLVPESDKRPAITGAEIYDDGYKED